MGDAPVNKNQCQSRRDFLPEGGQPGGPIRQRMAVLYEAQAAAQVNSPAYKQVCVGGSGPSHVLSVYKEHSPGIHTFQCSGCRRCKCPQNTPRTGYIPRCAPLQHIAQKIAIIRNLNFLTYSACRESARKNSMYRVKRLLSQLKEISGNDLLSS